MTESSKRPEHLAWAAMVMSLIAFGSAFLVGRWSEFTAVSALAWLGLSAAFIWFVLSVQFHMKVLAEQEKLDMSRLTPEEQASGIFRAGGERASLLAVAQQRVVLLERWFIPISSVLIAVYQAAIGLYVLRSALVAEEVETKEPLIAAIFTVAVAFVGFLISRYATGMSTEPRWKPLRAGGSCLLGLAIISFILAIGLVIAHWHKFQIVNVVSYAIGVLLVVLGIETVLNVVLDIYRPRLKGQYSRAAFDSRLLGIINEPGGVFRSAASAIDYQFGFKVSQTWFYRLLERAILPLVVFGAVSLYLLSCIVVVLPNEGAIIEHLGNPLDSSGNVRQVGSGLTLKWPWPIDIAYKYPTKRILELYIGYVPKTDPKTGEVIPETELLWGRTHYEQEHDLLVASEYTEQQTEDTGVPVSLVKANIPVQYRIKDLYSYIYKHSNPRQRLEAICYNELAKFGATATIEVDSETDLEHSLFGAGRSEAKTTLTRNIQKAADAAGLGVELVFVGLQGIHPPPEVAPDYQKVVSAVQEKQALILAAHALRNRELGLLIGSVAAAEKLENLADAYEQAKAEGRGADVERLAEQLDDAFVAAKGQVYQKIRDAESYAFDKAALARATGERFGGQLKSYQASPEVYKRDQRLNALSEGLQNVRKYVVVTDPNTKQINIIDMQEKLNPDVWDLPKSEENSQK